MSQQEYSLHVARGRLLQGWFVAAFVEKGELDAKKEQDKVCSAAPQRHCVVTWEAPPRGGCQGNTHVETQTLGEGTCASQGVVSYKNSPL